MAKYYAFLNRKHRTFCKTTSLRDALAIAKDEKNVFRHVDGIPNPWWVWPVENGKVNKKKILKGVP